MNQPGSFKKFDPRLTTLLRKAFQLHDDFGELEIYIAVKVIGKYTTYVSCPNTFSDITVVSQLSLVLPRANSG